MGELVVMSTRGDETLEWDAEDKASVKRARDKFNRLKKKGYRAYTAVVAKGSVVEKFDPSLGRIILAPPMAGGPATIRA